MTEPCLLSAGEAAAAIRVGSLTSEALVASCLRRIAAREPKVHAWAWLDPEAALAQARARDKEPARSPLHGIPIGVKDIIDTADMPTELGAVAFAGRRPEQDAAGIALLREAGAVILGKTVTTELAGMHPGPTANPRRTTHTPGGSSSGSAAAVADFHVPIALGSQTVGSIVRPASFCGVLGFKPTFDRYPPAGMMEMACHLDTLGGFARTAEDLLLLDACLARDTTHAIALEAPIVGVHRTAMWEEASPAVHAAFAATASALAEMGATVVDCPLPDLAPLSPALINLHLCEMRDCLGYLVEERPDGVSDEFKWMVDMAAPLSDDDYRAALEAQRIGRERFAEGVRGLDLLLTPSAKDVALEGLAITGDPLFCRDWSGLGVPSLGFPAAWESGLPVGLQFVGAAGSDRTLLATAGRLLTEIGVITSITVPHDHAMTTPPQ
jgi:Asp-tRNA(Asn)/Glu-tRNA(Gln) amidotransferase A subunit family amidase